MQIIPSILLILASLLILPESPRFLVKKSRADEARKVLAYVRHLSVEHEYVGLEMQEIEEAVRREDNPGGVGGSGNGEGGRWGLVSELWWKGNRGRVLIGVALMIGQNFTGINGVNFYTPTIFKSIGFSGTKVVLLASGESNFETLLPDFQILLGLKLKLTPLLLRHNGEGLSELVVDI